MKFNVKRHQQHSLKWYFNYSKPILKGIRTNERAQPCRRVFRMIFCRLRRRRRITTCCSRRRRRHSRRRRGAVGRVVIYDTGGPQFASRHRLF